MIMTMLVIRRTLIMMVTMTTWMVMMMENLLRVLVLLRLPLQMLLRCLAPSQWNCDDLIFLHHFQICFYIGLIMHYEAIKQN